MTTELQILVASIILGLVHLVAASHLISFQYGYRWTASSRDKPVPPLSGLANRVDQATTNFLETFPFFAALVLAGHVANRHSLLTICGVYLYFWARLGYLLAAAAGYGLVHSVLFWNTALTGIVLFPSLASLPHYRAFMLSLGGENPPAFRHLDYREKVRFISAID